MKRFLVLISLIFLFSVSDLFAQIDSVTFKFHRGISLYEFSFLAQKIDNGDTTEFSPTDVNYVFHWYIDLVEQTNDTLAVFRHKFPNDGNYTVDLDVYDIPNNTTISASRVVPVRDTILVPNVFSPNGDDYNEQFIVRSNGITPIEISIYSRTGTMVYKAKAPVIIWDGRNSSGSEMSEGIYYYILKSDDPNVPEKTGFVHLYR
jgi:gliding motility-associated-like protein